MTHIFDDPATFAEDMLAGSIDANARCVMGVPGGVVRRSITRPGNVAVVIGGGAGHYPAFCGVVGHGFADRAVVGNVFTSPSAEAAASVGRFADGGAGVVFGTGNYAGDHAQPRRGLRRVHDARFFLSPASPNFSIHV